MAMEKTLAREIGWVVKGGSRVKTRQKFGWVVKGGSRKITSEKNWMGHGWSRVAVGKMNARKLNGWSRVAVEKRQVRKLDWVVQGGSGKKTS